MSQAKAIPERSQIAPEYTWNTADLYPTDQAWQEDFSRLQAMVPKLAAYAGRCVENGILMYFRSRRKLAAEMSLSDALDTDGDGNSLSLMDVISVDDNMLEELDTREACAKVRRCVGECLDGRERDIITQRYGLDGLPPRTQREVAARCGISRSYVSRRH